jgi:WD40 repeat protein
MLGLIFEGENTLGVSKNSDIHVWTGAATSPNQTLRGHANKVTKIANFNNKWIVSGDDDGRILIWNPKTSHASRPPTDFRSKISVSALACNSTKLYVAFADQNIGQYSLDQDGKCESMIAGFLKLESNVQRIEATDDIVVYLTRSGQKLVKADVSDITKVLKEVDTGEISGFTIVSGSNDIWTCTDKGTISVIDQEFTKKEEDKEMKTWYGHPATSIISSPDGKWVAVGDKNGYVTLFSTETYEKVWYTAYHKNRVIDLKFTQDSEQLYTLGFDKLSFLVSVADSKSKRELSNPNGAAYANSCVTFSDDSGNYVLTGGNDCAIRMWQY